MATDNRIQLRHGSTVPQNGDLLPWELGVYEDRLFIGLNRTDSEGKWIVKELTFSGDSVQASYNNSSGI